MIRTERGYEINEVARLTGLSPARLRAWERRYELVRPRRLPNGYRAYSGEQVELLRAYARLSAAGERIGDLAAEPREAVIARAAAPGPPPSPDAPEPHRSALLNAVRALDRDRLEALLAEQMALRGLRAFAEEIVAPLARTLGDLWAAGRLPVAAEHLASEVVLHALKGGLRASRGGGPLALGACLPGERHEWGLLTALTVAQERGWRVHYLGPDLPLADVVEAAWTLGPRLIALSGSAPAVVEASLPSLAALPGRLPPGTLPVLGGAGAEPHAHQL
ncbi:MAG TPA: MerR family transcriptional regulator, partial [Gemmatimonadales bacterium]|nr:MerR family transcriptional regulator [Gemmatimonadales bacterium]